MSSTLSPLRAATLRHIKTESGATAESPIHFHGHSFTAARWLYDHGFVNMVGRGFYPLAQATREEQTEGT